MITDVADVVIGHWTDLDARTGCTAVVLPEGTVASGEVRGGAPATREFDLLAPERLVNRLDAVVLSGGSAFGLAAADGVMRWCEEQGRGFPTGAGPVPIVVGMSIFDLLVGDPRARPTAEHGYLAASTAKGGAHEVGAVGAGAGATLGKWRGREFAKPGGLGAATTRDGEVIVSALVVVNAWGDIDDGTEPPWPELAPTAAEQAFQNTTIGLIVTNARLDKVGCLLVAQGGHDGLARSLVPSHGRADGDAMVAAATGAIEAGIDHVRFLATRAVEQAVRRIGA
jgi:L-aminopeptidase/D-esterase-like protein